MRYLVSANACDGDVWLTNESRASGYGIPVLEVTRGDVRGTFGPKDIIGAPPRSSAPRKSSFLGGRSRIGRKTNAVLPGGSSINGRKGRSSRSKPRALLPAGRVASRTMSLAGASTQCTC
jgi:hypothetical protein